MSTNEMTATAHEYREIQSQIKTLEEMADALKQQMIREMDARQVDKLNAGDYTIRWIAYQSSRLYTTKLRQELPEIANQYSKSAVSTRFSVLCEGRAV